MTRLILNWLLVFVLLATTIFAVPESVAESQKKAETGDALAQLKGTQRRKCVSDGLCADFKLTAGVSFSVTLTMSGKGTSGNIIAALCSLFIPGLGQLLQGRWIKAIFMFVAAFALWLVLLGWIIHLWSIVDAAVFKAADQ